jgi:hypothetical protein
MKYNIYFEKDSSDGWGGDRLDQWKSESVVPRVGDEVFMEKGGWMTVVSVGFSIVEKKKNRNVLISVK